MQSSSVQTNVQVLLLDYFSFQWWIKLIQACPSFFDCSMFAVQIMCSFRLWVSQIGKGIIQQEYMNSSLPN